MYKVIFYTREREAGSLSYDMIVKHEIYTGKTTIEEAFEVALKNGLNPFSKCRYVWIEEAHKSIKE